jgi:long-chain acyl-CoA synthetase
MRLADYLLDLDVNRYDSVAWIDRNPNGSPSRVWTWIEVQRLTATVAIFLRDQSVGPGDRVVNLGCNSLAWAVLDLACSMINAVHVPVDSRFSISQKEHCIELVKPTLIFSDTPDDAESKSLDQLTSLPPRGTSIHQIASRFSPNDLANILFTSGTTGIQKGVMLSHKNLLSNALAKLDAMPQSHSDHRLNFLPFSHAYARTCELTAWLVSHSSMEVASGIEGVLKQAEYARATLLNGVPVFYESLVKKSDQTHGTRSLTREILGGQIRRLASGGATLSQGTRARFAKIGLPIYQGYGLTESSPVICSNRSEENTSLGKYRDANLSEVGPPVKGMTVRIDETGRLWASGDGVMLGYWQDPEGTRAKIVDGWLDTGDLAEYVDKSKDLDSSTIRILGRSDDTLVLSNGYKVQPHPIEQIIVAEPWVSQCLLVGTNLPFPVLILKPIEANHTTKLPSQMLLRIEELLNEFPRVAIPRRLIVTDEVWTKENGLVNFKGGLMRKRIETYYQSRINEQCTAPVS